MNPRYGSLRASGLNPLVMRCCMVISIDRISHRPPRYKYLLSKSPCLFSSLVQPRLHLAHAESVVPVGSSHPSKVLRSV